MFALLGVGVTNTQRRRSQPAHDPARGRNRPRTDHRRQDGDCLLGARGRLEALRAHLRRGAAVRAGHGLLLVGGQRVDGPRGRRGGRPGRPVPDPARTAPAQPPDGPEPSGRRRLPHPELSDAESRGRGPRQPQGCRRGPGCADRRGPGDVLVTDLRPEPAGLLRRRRGVQRILRALLGPEQPPAQPRDLRALRPRLDVQDPDDDRPHRKQPRRPGYAHALPRVDDPAGHGDRGLQHRVLHLR